MDYQEKLIKLPHFFCRTNEYRYVKLIDFFKEEVAMRRCIPLFLVCVLSLALFSGCGAPVGGEFESNAKAVELLGGKTFGDPDGNVSLTFDENGKLVDLAIKDIPAEFQGIKIDGTPFSFAVPTEYGIPDAFAGMEITASLENTETTINPDGTIQLVFDGKVNIPLVQGITLTITAQGNESATELNNLGVSLTATAPFIGEIPIFSQENIAGNIPVVQQ
jgi:hypothetical protein